MHDIHNKGILLNLGLIRVPLSAFPYFSAEVNLPPLQVTDLYGATATHQETLTFNDIARVTHSYQIRDPHQFE